jgi:hypothetical protein
VNFIQGFYSGELFGYLDHFQDISFLKSYPQPADGTLAMLREQNLSDIFEDISLRFKKFEQKITQSPDPDRDTGQQMV